MSNQYQNAHRMAGLVASIVLLSACNGGGNSGSQNEVVTPPIPVGDSGNDLVAIVPTLSWDTWLAEGQVFADRDEDGIQDAYDTWPDSRPILVESSSANSLSITRAWTEIDGNDVLETAVEGYALNLEVTGLPSNAGEPIWVVFQTNDGLRGSPATVINANTLTVDPVPEALGAHVVAGASRGVDHRVYSIRQGQPAIFTNGTTVMAGSRLTLGGVDLDKVERVMLGDMQLPILEQSSSSLAVQAPDSASSNQLFAQTKIENTNVLEVDLRQSVELRAASDLGLAQSENLRFWIAGDEGRISHTGPVVMDFPAWMPTVISFDIASSAGTRSYNQLHAVVWPGDDVVEVSTRSSLQGRLVNIRHLLPGAQGDNWQQVRAALDRVVTLQAAQDYFSALAEHAANRSAAPQESLLGAVISAYRDIAMQGLTLASASAPKNDIAVSAPSTPFGDLDEIVASTLTYVGEGETGDKEGSSEGGYSYPEQTFGPGYSQTVILRHEDVQLITPDFKFFSGCEFSDGESAWYALRQASSDPYKRVWKSDLCMQIDGLAFVSAAIVVPGFKDPKAIFDSAARGNDPKELVHRHSQASFLDDSHQYGKGGYYLRGDDGLPLCHMETCYIEVVTSGFGAYYNVPLGQNQRNLVETLRTRMIVEGLIPWILGLTGGSATNTLGVEQCLRADLLKNGGMYTAVGQFGDWIKANKNKTGDDLVLAIYDGLDQKIYPWVKKYVQSQLGPEFIKCTQAIKPADEIQNAVRDKLLSETGLSAFAEVLAFVTNLGSAVLTPEKFVFKIQHRAEITSISPKTINLYDDTATLTIDGDWLGNVDLNAASPCIGEGWCPELVVVDTIGGPNRVKSIQLDDSHIEGISNCGIACTRLSIPVSELGALQDLASGPINVELAIFDADYSSYPGNRLRVPVPGNVMRLATEAKMYSVSPPLARPLETITVKGSGLSAYGASAKYALRDESGNRPDVPVRKAEDSPDSDAEVRLIVPPGIATGQYKVVLQAGSDATEDALAELTSVVPLLVTGEQLPLIVVGDNGVVKDDHMRVELLDEGDFIVSATIPYRDLAWDLPTNEANTNVPPQTYVYGESWLEDFDADGKLIYITAEVAKVRVKCVSSGADGTCSYSVRSGREKLCRFANDTKVNFALTAKIGEGEVRVYNLAFKDAPCSDYY